MNTEEFWKNIDKTDKCWLWTRAKISTGYGKVQFWGKPWLTHRLAWTLTNGPIPNGLWVLHKCDNPPCCNPAHLFLGNRSDNMQDCAAKGRLGMYVHPERAAYGERNGSRLYPERLARGEKNFRAKLTAEAVLEICRLHATGCMSREQLSHMFGVSTTHISRVAHNKIWRHITQGGVL